MAKPPIIDLSTSLVIQAVERFGKSRLAAVAKVRESSIRAAGRDGWNPTAGTLRKLEIAAAALVAKDARRGAKAHRDSRGRNPAGARADA